MGLRETLNEKPAIAASAAGVLVLAVGVFLYYQMSDGPRPQATTQAFFSDDDGQSWFVDEMTKVPPFTHDGKQAYRAVVCQCAGGKPFVAYLETYTDAEHARMQESLDKNPQSAALVAMTPASNVKKPGDPHWVQNSDAAAYQRVTTPVCPDGSTTGVVRLSPDTIKK